MDWKVIYEDGVPVQMRWRPQARRQRLERRCPRTFPHSSHGPWFDGQLRPAGDGPGGFDCPGVEAAK